MSTNIAPELEEEIKQHPPAVQAVMRSHPPVTCYRDSERPGRGHYWIRSYIETLKRTDGSPGPVHVTMVHGRDSFLPSMTVNGTDPAELTVCGCGKWQNATEDQIYYMREHLSMLHLARVGAARPSGPEGVQVHLLRARFNALHRLGTDLVTVIDTQTIAAALRGNKFRSQDVERAYADFRLALMMFAPDGRSTDTREQPYSPPFILCKTCGLKSYNPYDIGLRYCGQCHKFHDDEGQEGAGYELGPAS
jgi:hypothetical protein